jgi:hypothetical protein
MDSNTIILIVLGSLSVPAIVAFFMKLKRQQDEIIALIKTRFDPRKTILRDKVFLIAQQSRGYSQRQGLGDLILTKDELFFALPMPKVVISIPLNNIGVIEQVRRMCAKQGLRPFHKIHYTDDQGDADAIGVRPKDMTRWKAEIRRLQARATTSERMQPQPS